MITVNLRPDLKRKRRRRPLQGALDGAKGFATRIKDPVPLVAAVSWVAVLGWLGYVVLGTTRELSALTPQLEQSRAENKRFKAFLTEKRHQELIRDSLVSQIGTIRAVDGDRYVWPHLLDEVDPRAAGLHLARGSRRRPSRPRSRRPRPSTAPATRRTPPRPRPKCRPRSRSR